MVAAAGPNRGGASGSAFSIGRSSSSRAVSTALPIASSVPPFSTKARSFAHPSSPTPAAQPHSAGSLRFWSRPATIRCREVPDGNRITSYFADRSCEIRGSNDLVIDAVLLEHPHQPAAGHVVGAAIQPDAGAGSSSGTRRRRECGRPHAPGGLARSPRVSTILCAAGVGANDKRAGRERLAVRRRTRVAARNVGTFAFCSSATT